MAKLRVFLFTENTLNNLKTLLDLMVTASMQEKYDLMLKVSLSQAQYNFFESPHQFFFITFNNCIS